MGTLESLKSLAVKRLGFATGLSVVLSMLVTAGLAAPAWAGIYYESVTTDDRSRDRIVSKGWVEGEKARIELEGLDKSMMPRGTYLVTSDGGRTVYLVNPKEETYSRWDMEALFETLGQVMEAMGPMMDISIENPQVEKQGQEPGGTLVGLPTTRYRYRTRYDFQVKVMGMKRASQIDMEQDIWATDAVEAPGMGLWLRADRPTGFEGLDELIQAEMGKMQGFPLKTVTVTTTTNKKGKKNTSRSTMEVTTLDQSRSIPDATFEIPAGYRETEAMPLAGAESQGGGDEDGQGKNPLKKLFGGGG